MAIFSNLGRILSSVMPSPFFSPSNPFVGPKNHPYPSKYLLKHVFLSSQPSKWGGGAKPRPKALLVLVVGGCNCHIFYIHIWAFDWGGGGHFGGFDAKWEVFRPFFDFLMDVGGSTIENMGPPYFGHAEFKNQGFGLI